MKFDNKKLIFVLGLLLPIASHAVPVKFPACANNVKVTDVPGGQGSVLNEDCTVLYVLPAQTGSLSVNGYVPSANLSIQCDRLRKIEQDSNNLEEVSSSTTRRLKKMAEELEQIEANLNDGLVPVGQTRESMEARMEALSDKMTKMRGDLITWQGQNDTKKLNFSKIEGGRGKFLMQTKMPSLLEEYKKANPRLRVVEMPIDQGFISINEVKNDESSSSAMPAVLSLRAVGISKMPMLRDPNLLLQFKDLNPGQAPDGSKIFNGALSGELQVSNMGACALMKNLSSSPNFTASDIKGYIAPSATYGYQVQVNRKHKISYNFKELVKQIHEQTKRGGFFSTKTMNSFIDQRATSTWIKFEVESNDTRFEYSDTYIREVKKEFLDRAIAQIVSLQTGSPTAMLALIEPGKNGATETGDALGKCPHLYCQIGAAGIKVLNSIFGSSTAVSQLLKTVSGEMVEVVDEKRMIPVYGTYSFE